MGLENIYNELVNLRIPQILQDIDVRGLMLYRGVASSQLTMITVKLLEQSI